MSDSFLNAYLYHDFIIACFYTLSTFFCLKPKTFYIFYIISENFRISEQALRQRQRKITIRKQSFLSFFVIGRKHHDTLSVIHQARCFGLRHKFRQKFLKLFFAQCRFDNVQRSHSPGSTLEYQRPLHSRLWKYHHSTLPSPFFRHRNS